MPWAEVKVFGSRLLHSRHAFAACVVQAGRATPIYHSDTGPDMNSAPTVPDLLTWTAQVVAHNKPEPKPTVPTSHTASYSSDQAWEASSLPHVRAQCTCLRMPAAPVRAVAVAPTIVPHTVAVQLLPGPIKCQTKALLFCQGPLANCNGTHTWQRLPQPSNYRGVQGPLQRQAGLSDTARATRQQPHQCQSNRRKQMSTAHITTALEVHTT